MLQFLNPKGITVALPIAAVLFPSAGITDGYLVVINKLIAVLLLFVGLKMGLPPVIDLVY